MQSIFVIKSENIAGIMHAIDINSKDSAANESRLE